MQKLHVRTSWFNYKVIQSKAYGLHRKLGTTNNDLANVHAIFVMHTLSSVGGRNKPRCAGNVQCDVVIERGKTDHNRFAHMMSICRLPRRTDKLKSLPKRTNLVYLAGSTKARTWTING